jgi:hypothetical protein
VYGTSDIQSLFSSPLSDLEPKPEHAALVLVYRREAVLLGIGGLGEEHAFVALGLLLLAHAAGLCLVRSAAGAFVGFARTLGFEASAFRGAACAAGGPCPREAIERTGQQGSVKDKIRVAYESVQLATPFLLGLILKDCQTDGQSQRKNIESSDVCDCAC